MFLMQKLFLLNHIKMFHGSHQKVLIYETALFQKLSLKSKRYILNFLSPHPTLPSICGALEEINNILMPPRQGTGAGRPGSCAHFNHR